MPKKIIFAASCFSLAFIILAISIFRIAEIKYVFSKEVSEVVLPSKVAVDYNLPSPGIILPDNPLWPLKVIRDNIWLSLNPNPSKKAELYLLFADQRLASSQVLIKKGNINLGVSVLIKGEKYLESAENEILVAKKEGMNTKDFLKKLALATLKHREVLDQTLSLVPEDARPLIVKTEDCSKKTFNNARNGLLEAGLQAPINPFE